MTFNTAAALSAVLIALWAFHCVELADAKSENERANLAAVAESVAALEQVTRDLRESQIRAETTLTLVARKLGVDASNPEGGE